MFFKKNKIIERNFLAISNVSRNLLLSFFGLFLNYLLLRTKDLEILNTYVYFISAIGLLYIFINWGGKFYNTKEISNNPKDYRPFISSLFSSKILLLLFFIILFLFMPIQKDIKLFIIPFLLLKSLVPIFDSLILFRKKSKIILLLEVVFYTAFLCLLYFFPDKFSSTSFIASLLILETLKTVTYFIYFRNDFKLNISLTNGIKVLKNSIYYFGLSLAGFLASKSDLYIVGILIDKETMSYYFVLSNLLNLSMLVYASFINTFETSIYRFNSSLFRKIEKNLKYFGLIFSIIATIIFYLIAVYFYKINVDMKLTIMFLLNIF
ncbi:hypothetical protein, partial [Flavobacterium sp. 9AF]|uniref:hypothetical protein n=1 Tax=Flavobacterium sp. 9AF TaxID=2653142 RepID=UPI00135B14D5